MITYEGDLEGASNIPVWANVNLGTVANTVPPCTQQISTAALSLSTGDYMVCNFDPRGLYATVGPNTMGSHVHISVSYLSIS